MLARRRMRICRRHWRDSRGAIWDAQRRKLCARAVLGAGARVEIAKGRSRLPSLLTPRSVHFPEYVQQGFYHYRHKAAEVRSRREKGGGGWDPSRMTRARASRRFRETRALCRSTSNPVICGAKRWLLPRRKLVASSVGDVSAKSTRRVGKRACLQDRLDFWREDA